MKTKTSRFRFGYDVGDFLSSAFAGWLFAVLVTLFLQMKKEGKDALTAFFSSFGNLRTLSDLLPLVAVTLFFLILYTELIGLFSVGRRIVSDILLVEYLVFSVLLALYLPDKINEIAALSAILVFLVPVVLRFVSTHKEDGERQPFAIAVNGEECRDRGRFAPVLVFGVAVSALFGAAVAAIGVMRYLGYSAPNFDFGIFCQMYENMAKTGAPVTTCERDGLLSHFAVHTSPILYLLLPFYFVFRTPITLAVGQVVIIYSGIVPLLLIGRRRGLSNRLLVLLSVVFAAYPVIGTGCFYDFHENCFLLPLLLWVFWFSECGRPIPLFLFALLTLSVKEDAFVYLVIFALFLLFAEKKWKTGLPLLVLSLGYFLLVSALMKKYGEGVMDWRYSNLVSKEEGLLGVIVTVFTNPGYVLTQIFTTTAGDAGKFKYVAALLLPLGCLPCLTRRASRWILLTPVLLNLMTMYVYQPNINFQYSFGISAFFLYAATLNLADFSKTARSVATGSLFFSAVACVVAFSLLVLPMIPANADRIKAWKGKHETITETLDEIPKDASVCATTRLVPHLYDHGELYETTYHTASGVIKLDCDYYAFDLRYRLDDKTNAQISRLQANGYVEYFRENGTLLILVKASLLNP